MLLALTTPGIVLKSLMDIGAIRNTEEAMVVGILFGIFVGVLVKTRQVVTLMEEMVGALFWVNVRKDRHTGIVIRLRNHVIGGENNFPVFVIMA